MNIPPAQAPHIPTRTAIEICVESIDFALAAQRAGADRIELCTNLSCGGLTPSNELIRNTRAALKIPIHVLIRPREGNFQYSAAEFKTIKRDIAFAKECGMDGIVAGILNDGRIDRERTRELVEFAAPLPFTFHRAFDECTNLEAALADVIGTGTSRVLTSGGKPRASDAVAEISRLVQIAGNRMIVMPGGGVRAENVQSLLQATRAAELHSSLGESAKKSPRSSHSTETSEADFEQRVRQLKHNVRQFECGSIR